MSNLSQLDLAGLVGDPRIAAQDLKEFQKNAKSFVSRLYNPEIKYRGKWVVTYGGRIQVQGRSVGEVMEKLAEKKVSPTLAAFRFFPESRRNGGSQ